MRIIDAVKQRPQHQQGEDSADREHAPPLGDKGSADAARRDGGRCRFQRGRCTGRAARDCVQTQQCQQCIERGQSGQSGEGQRGIVQRQSARRLAEQHRHVPAHRQDSAPEQCKRVHAQNWKSDAREAERGRDDDAGEAQADREVAHQKLQQRSQRQVGDDQQHSRGDHHEGVAPERDPEQPLQNERHHQHDDDEDREQGCKLARQCDDRVAARAGEPVAHAAPAELGANRVAGGQRDAHMEHHRQQRTQQELGVIPLRVDQHDGLGDERSDTGHFRRPADCGRRAGGRGSEAVAQPRRCDARGGEELLVIEGDDLRAALGLQVALEVGRDIDRGDGTASADRARRGGEIAGALDDAEIGRCRHLFHEGARGVRFVRVDDDYSEPADHRMTEYRGQHREGEQRHAEDQDERCAVMQQPSAFAPGDEPKPRLRRRVHPRVRQSV